MKVRIVNNSRYKPETCCNGGDYGFTETYISIGGGKFELIYGTTSEFPYCEFCGSFYQGDCSCHMREPEVVDLKTVNSEISYAMRKYAQGEDWEIIIM